MVGSRKKQLLLSCTANRLDRRKKKKKTKGAQDSVLPPATQIQARARQGVECQHTSRGYTSCTLMREKGVIPGDGGAEMGAKLPVSTPYLVETVSVFRLR